MNMKIRLLVHWTVAVQLVKWYVCINFVKSLVDKDCLEVR